MEVYTKLKKQITELQDLLTSLRKMETYVEKVTILDSLPLVQDYLKHSERIRTFLNSLTPEAAYAIKSIIALGQGPVVFNMQTIKRGYFNRLVQLLEQLLEIEIFYQHIGGIIGYHLTVITNIVSQKTPSHSPPEHASYIHPEGMHLGNESSEVRQAVRWGIENIQNIAAVYPLGGAGDRLNLKDEATGIALPVACLPFLGHPLLEGLIRDLQALEYLSYKVTGKQTMTPIAIMTSVEKDNHIHILRICKEKNWFGRPQESFYFFIQPVVPVITCEGYWSLSAPLTLTLKPSGHGVLWKLAEEQGVFQWLESEGRTQCLIRQINNPIAGTDNILLSLIGIGCHEQKAFGFASCERLLNSDEGTNVLIEKQSEEGYDYCLTNIEYTDFSQKRNRRDSSKTRQPLFNLSH